MKSLNIFSAGILVLLLGSVAPGIVRAQDVPPDQAVALRSAADLDLMLGAIALYPDPLIAQILPAATQPGEIVDADRYVQSGQDINMVDQQPWDSSVKALTRYPAVLKWMDDNITWAAALGQAWLAQPNDVMDAIQRLRAKAQALGNLRTTPQEQVIADVGSIEIVPADPEVIYVPYYDPGVIYSQPPPPNGWWLSFGIGFPVGLWLNHDFDWRGRHIFVWHRDHPRPRDWWHQPPGHRPPPPMGSRGGNVWHPRPGVVPGRVDRGWEHRPSPPVHAEPRPAPRPMPRPVERPVQNPRAFERPPQAPIQNHPVIIPSSRPAGGALIGVQNTHDTSAFSNRGQQSRGAMSRPAQVTPPPTRAVPPMSRPSSPPVSRPASPPPASHQSGNRRP